MDASSLNATLAYRNQLKLMEQSQDAGPEVEKAAAGPSFAQMVGESLKDSADTLRATDALEMQAVTGRVDLTDLVTAVTNAELTLNTVVAVRDRVINAYQDILRMGI